MEMIFGEFKGIVEPDADQDKEDWSMSGDVKYHLGSTYKRKYPDGRKVTLSLLANPSHLEAVNPLVSGKARAKMHYKGDKQGKSVLPVLMHGDAAFAGQGIVFESMQFSRTSDFATGGKYIQFYSTLLANNKQLETKLTWLRKTNSFIA